MFVREGDTICIVAIELLKHGDHNLVSFFVYIGHMPIVFCSPWLKIIIIPDRYAKWFRAMSGGFGSENLG
jgi:hypothetical protein